MNPFVTPFDAFLINFWLSAFVGMATFNFVWLGGLAQAVSEVRS